MDIQNFKRFFAFAICGIMGLYLLYLDTTYFSNEQIIITTGYIIFTLVMLYRNKRRRTDRFLAVALVGGIILLAILSMNIFFKTNPPQNTNELQRTVAIIKPDAVAAGHTDDIIKQIEMNGFRVVAQKQLTIDKAAAQQFYIAHKNRPFFNDLIASITSGPSQVLILERQNAVQVWRNLMGAADPQKADPGTTRQLYGTDIQHNAVHGSDSVESAEREMEIFFPRS